MRAAEAGEAMQRGHSSTLQHSTRNDTAQQQSHNSTLQHSTHNDSVKQQGHDSTLRQGENDNDVTVDPDVTMELPTKPQKLIFTGKTMAIFGFEGTYETELKEYIVQNGGKVVPSTSRSIPDYAVLPVFGDTVGITVRDIVTNAWIQKCVEENCVLPIEEDELFVPIEVCQRLLTGEGEEPLQGCVLSVSGYQGCIRDALIHLAEFLGARVQEYFIRRAIPEKKLEANTHLIVNGGQNSKKFVAAKKWKIPAINKGYELIVCFSLIRHVK